MKLTKEQKRQAMKRERELAKQELIYHLNNALNSLYLAGMENNGAVLTMNIKDLYNHLTKVK